MTVHPARLAPPPESRSPEEIPPEPRLLMEEGELTDEEAFYLAQEESFADLRARFENRPRRKM